MSLNIKIILVVLALITALLGMMQAKYKKIATICSFICIGFVAIFSVVDSILDYKEKKSSELEDNARYSTTIRKSDTLIQNLNSALDTIRAIQSLTSLIKDSMEIELELQKENTKKSDSILRQQGTLSSSQTSMLKQIDQTINPLFPITIYLEATFPFDHPSLTDLTQYASSMLEKTKNTNRLYPNYLRMDFAEVKKVVQLPHDRLINPPTISLSIIRSPVSVEKINTSSKVRFYVGENLGTCEENQYILSADFRSRTFIFKQFYTACNLKDLSVPGITQELTDNIGYNDLKDCYILLEVRTRISNYRLITLELMKDHQKVYRINFDSTHMRRFSRQKSYLYRITEKNLSQDVLRTFHNY